ncbi:carboxylic acid reductase [Paractinoplanes ferrugineus]|uniref:Carboxylic acid reductase n=1 Tax=Paractinoplanes ferrugineus TaxID=113564 RepID=A0A919J5R3_9ACTN|nr:carboxylic acid reductase [Actinoplanes ferrugineus]GIE13089.1 putative fatty-acid-CoA ligase FadD [Actinoplanes ferrugineus]
MSNDVLARPARGRLAANRSRRIETVRADPELADRLPLPEVLATTATPGLRLPEIVELTLAGYADRPALAERAREFVSVAGHTELRRPPRFDSISYRELSRRLRAVAADWYHHADHPLRPGDFVAVLGFAGIDYTVVDLAAGQVGAVVVPLHNTATVAHIRHLVDETAPRVFATTTERLDTVLEALAGTTSVVRLIVFDHCPELEAHTERLTDARRRLTEAASPTTVEVLSDVIERGTALRPAPALPPVADTRDVLSALIYTSGSTGTPKGVIFPESTVSMMWRPAEQRYPMITANFLPQSHLVARRLVIKTLALGGTACFVADSNLATLLEDLALIRPTEFALVPRVCELLHQSYQTRLNQRGADQAESLRAHFRDVVLGGRVIHTPCGSAPLAPELAAFIESCLEVPFLDSYGTTETGLVMLDHQVQRAFVRDYKLVDVPELGYRTTDTPYPRGELLVRSALITPGYYRRPDITAAAFDDDGYYRTGDVMAEVAPDRLHYVDRRNNVLKLAQGEFVALARLEAALVTSPLVHQIYLYGNSSRSYLLAVVVPTPEALDRASDETALKAAIHASLRHVAAQADLQPYEIPRDLLIETVPFSQDNGLLSDSTKQLRPRLKERYGEQLERRYAALAEEQVDNLRGLRHDEDRPVVETVRRAARALLGASVAEPEARARFTDLGGDSLTALALANALKDIFGTEVQVATMLGPAGTLEHIAARIEGRRGGPGHRATFAGVHGEDATEVRAADLTLDKFIDPATLDTAPALPPTAERPSTVLLTGANGYLGRLLCLAWSRRLAPTGGKLVCLVRAADDRAARARLEQSLDSGDLELKREYAEAVGAGTLQVLAGDVSAPNLGLDDRTWHRLAATVDTVVHAAALVNHVLPYRQLFESNVVGTAEVVRLALTTRRKAISFLSSVAMASHGAGSLDEDSDVRVADAVRPIDSRHAGGYATSKWAGEVLLRQAHDRYGLPVTVFRSGMILAHRRYTGQLNVPDTFTRLLLSLIVTGVAPASFYRGDASRAHYDGLPGDFVAASVAALGSAASGYRTFSVVNPHDDGVSLDTVVDWLAGCGVAIRRIDDYREWYGQFEAALRALPDQQRQNSLLPLLHVWREPAEPRSGSAFPSSRFREAAPDIPHLSRALIDKYVSDLRHLGLI